MSFLRRSKDLARWMLERSRESWRLLAGRIAPRRHATLQETLVHEARQGQNATAVSLLRTQKEWNDIKYYGLVPYLQRKISLPSSSSSLWPQSLLSSPFGTTASDAISTAATAPSATAAATATPSSPAPTPTTAKVAFMVTAKMKGRLIELGYSGEEIKSLTPTEASLLIEHAVPTTSKAERLPRLVQEYEEQRERLLQAQDQPEANAAAPPSTELSTASENTASSAAAFSSPPLPRDDDDSSVATTTTISGGGPSLAERLLGSMASANVRGQPAAQASRTYTPTSSSSTRRDWYEVVEEYENPSAAKEEVVALHATENDATVDANLRREM